MTDPSAPLENQAALQADDLGGQAMDSRSYPGSGTNPLSTTDSDGVKPLQQQHAMGQVRSICGDPRAYAWQSVNSLDSERDCHACTLSL